MGKAINIQLTTEERAKLEATLRSSTAPVREVLRSRIVLLAAAGKSNQEIAVKLGIHRHSVALWRRRFARQGLPGLEEKPRRGRKRLYEADAVATIVDTTLNTKLSNATHWSTRTLAKRVGASHSTVHRVWRAHQIKPHLLRTFKLSWDPHFIDKLRDVVGLYLNPPEHALVFSVDEKSGIQALDRYLGGGQLRVGAQDVFPIEAGLGLDRGLIDAQRSLLHLQETLKTAVSHQALGALAQLILQGPASPPGRVRPWRPPEDYGRPRNAAPAPRPP